MEHSEFYPGKAYPLGAPWDKNGVNFALYSENQRVLNFACLRRINLRRKVKGISVKERTHNIWHVYIPGFKTRTAIWL
jgi:glycogen operon protein